MKNNLFSFATSELSQDAFICWCLNWINYPNENLYSMAKAIFSNLLEEENIRNIKQRPLTYTLSDKITDKL